MGNAAIHQNSNIDIMQSMVVGDFSLWEQARVDYHKLSSYHESVKGDMCISVVKPDGTVCNGSTPANYNTSTAKDFVPNGGFGILDKVIKGKVIYANETTTMSIALDINWLEYNMLANGGDVSEGVASYNGKPGYIAAVNKWLSVMNKPQLPK